MGTRRHTDHICDMTEFTFMDLDIEQPPPSITNADLATWLSNTTKALCAEPYHPASKFVAPDCVYDSHDGREGAVTREEKLQLFRIVHQQYPEWKTIVHDASPQIFREEGYAHVYLNFTVTGCPPGTDLKYFSVIEWRYRDGQWLVVRSTAFRAPPSG